jgi:protein gp37
MGSKTGIAWTDRTYNPWWGCTRISPACDNCYAATMASNHKLNVWGAGVPRKRTSEANRKMPIAWNRQAVREGVRYKVFTLSMGDVLDGEVPQSWRDELWETIDQTPNLDWQLLSKRPENYHRFLPAQFKHENIWLGTTAENQHYYDTRWPALARLRDRFPAAPLWISYEPALGPITLNTQNEHPDWVIFGGESGGGHRPMQTSWADSILAECEVLGASFFMKQMAAATLVKAKELIPTHLLIRQYPAAFESTARAPISV